MLSPSYHSNQAVNDNDNSIPGSVYAGRNNKVKLTVCCRVRPVIPGDYKSANTKRSNAPEICVHCHADGQSMKLIQDSMHFKQFKVDHTFDTSSKQKDVYQTALLPIVEDVLQGYNGTCIVYGQTTSGKTYTMFGADKTLGIAHLAINQIFDTVAQYEQHDLVAKVYMTFYQIYIENVFDLLSDSPKATPQPLNIRNDDASFYVEGLKYVHVKDRDMAYHTLGHGLQRRVIHSTAHNIRSSRSHAILQLHLDFEERNEDMPEHASHYLGHQLIEKKYIVRHRTLTLVDLAGSERVVSYRQAAKQQLAEACMINKSIAALGNCIYALSNREHTGDANAHIPYRDCKLTRLLADSLGGNSKTCIIATVSPCVYNYDETISTLKFAARAKVVRKVVKKTRTKEIIVQPDVLPFLEAVEEEENNELLASTEYDQQPSHHNPPYPTYPPSSHTPSHSMYHSHQSHSTHNVPSSQYQSHDSTSPPPPPPPPTTSTTSTLSQSNPKLFSFEKPANTFSLRDFLQACTITNKAFDPESSERFDLPPLTTSQLQSQPQPYRAQTPDDISMLGTSSRPGTPSSYSSHPSKIDSAVEVIPQELDAYQQAILNRSSHGKSMELQIPPMEDDSQFDDIVQSLNEITQPSPPGKASMGEFQFQTNSQPVNYGRSYVVKCHKGVQTWSMTPNVDGRAMDGFSLDDFGSVLQPNKMDQMTEIDEVTLLYTTNTIQDPTQRDELLKLAKLSPMELVCSLVELRNAVVHLNESLKQRDEQVRLLQELVMDVPEPTINTVSSLDSRDLNAVSVDLTSSSKVQSFDFN